MNRTLDDRKSFSVTRNSSVNISAICYPGSVPVRKDDERVRKQPKRPGFNDNLVLVLEYRKIRKAIDDFSIKGSLSQHKNFISTSLNSNPYDFDWVNNQNPYDRIENIGRLPDNWDGYGAPRFKHSHIQRCKKIYLAFVQYSFRIKNTYSSIQPFVAPCSDGSILFEWSGKRFPIRQLEISIPANKNELISFLKSSGAYEEENEVNDTMLRPLFDWLFNTLKSR